MMWLKLAKSTRQMCRHDNLVMIKPHIRSLSQVSHNLDIRYQSNQPLYPRSILFAGHPSLTLALVLQHRRTVTTDRTGWYESIAESTPVCFTEQLLVSTQHITGLPWWASIMCTTLALRTAVTLPLGIYQTIIIAKVEALQREIAKLAHQLRFEISVKAKEKGWSEKTCRFHFKKNLKRIVSELYVRDNCHPFKASLLIWVQLPMWVCLSLALRNLSLGVGHVPLASEAPLATGGALWFPDLTLPDSTWIIPVSLGLINLLITEICVGTSTLMFKLLNVMLKFLPKVFIILIAPINSWWFTYSCLSQRFIFALRQLESSKIQKYVTNFIRGISLVMIPIAATVPSSMSLYWLSSSCVGLAHNLLMKSPRFRSVCRIPPTRSDSESPYKDIAAAFVAKYIK